MSLYEMVGEFLGGASQVLEEGSITGRDERSQRDLRQIALLNKRVSIMLPQLFAGLWRENRKLAETLTDVRDRIALEGLPQKDLPPEPDDPVADNGRLIRALNEAEAILLHHAAEPWAVEARKVFRRGLTDAIRAQGGAVEAAWHV